MDPALCNPGYLDISLDSVQGGDPYLQPRIFDEVAFFHPSSAFLSLSLQGNVESLPGLQDRLGTDLAAVAVFIYS